jgi:Uma2 family endonuclease
MRERVTSAGSCRKWVSRWRAIRTPYVAPTSPSLEETVFRRDRLPDPEPAGFPDFAPDLVVEVLSPGDRPGEILAKVADWLSAGTRLVWVVDPLRRVARVSRQDGSETIVTADAALEGEDALPRFACPLATIL